MKTGDDAQCLEARPGSGCITSAYISLARLSNVDPSNCENKMRSVVFLSAKEENYKVYVLDITYNKNKKISVVVK